MYKHTQIYKTNDKHEILEHWADTNALYASDNNNNISIDFADIKFLENIIPTEEEAIKYAESTHNTETIAVPFNYGTQIGYVVIGWIYK